MAGPSVSAYFDHELGDYILPYASVRAAPDPDEVLLEFFQSIYDAAANLGKWDRPSLEVAPRAAAVPNGS